MFTHTTRKIALHEYMRGNYPQLEVILTVSNGKKRSLKTDSGHGLAQIIKNSHSYSYNFSILESVSDKGPTFL